VTEAKDTGEVAVPSFRKVASDWVLRVAIRGFGTKWTKGLGFGGGGTLVAGCLVNNLK